MPRLNLAGWQSVLNSPCRDPRWLAVKDERVRSLPGLKAVHDIHIWCRRNIQYRFDINDNWALPFETFGRREGDCEDFSILERALLIAAGWPSSSIWFVIVEDIIERQIHAMLMFERFLLDSRADKITIAAQAKDYTPMVAYCDDQAVTFGHKS